MQSNTGASTKSGSCRNTGVRGDDSGVDSTDEVDSSDAARERGGVIGGTGEMDIAAKGVVNEEAYACEKKIGIRWVSNGFLSFE